MVYASGKALIKHEKTGQVYEIESDLLDFEVVGTDERNMGPETTYSAVLHHPELGQLVWSIWEYPVGAENDRETDVGPHELLEDINFGLGYDAPDDEEELQSRIDSLVEWFHERYEDPAQRLPYISKEGGYQWIYGGPYDAREVLADNFPKESEEIIEAAVEEIESDGLTDWAPVSKPEDYGEDYYEEEPESGGDLQEIVTELGSLLSDLPTPQAAPAFRFGDDGLIHLSSPPDLQSISSEDELFEELTITKNSLLQTLAGTNAHTILLQAVEHYNQAFFDRQVSISRLYARGIMLENTASVIERNIASDSLPALPPEVERNLYSTLELHRTYIMSQDEGKELVDAASAYRYSPQQTEALRNAGRQLTNSVANNPNLFGNDAREYIESVVQEIGKGNHPERSNQLAVAAFASLFTVIANQAIITSVPGAAAATLGADTINAAWSFLLHNAPLLQVIAASAVSDLSWMTSFSYLVNRLKGIKRPSNKAE